MADIMKNVKSLHAEMAEQVTGLEESLGRFYAGNKSAGKEARKFLQDIRKGAREMRREVMDARKAMKGSGKEKPAKASKKPEKKTEKKTKKVKASKK